LEALLVKQSFALALSKKNAERSPSLDEELCFAQSWAAKRLLL
jgi:hypothetical protein